MSDDNFYKAPEAELQVDNSEFDELFAVSTRKLWIMHLLTFGIYDVYWFYQQWKHMKFKRNLNVWPLVRAAFLILFVYPTFRNVQRAAERKQLGGVPNLKLMALVLYLIYFGSIAAVFVFPDAFLISPWFALCVNIMANVLTGFVLATVQRTANGVIDDEEGLKNSRITALNIVWIVVALLYNGLAVLGSTVEQ